MLDAVLCLKIYNELEVQDNCTACTRTDIDTLVVGGDAVHNNSDAATVAGQHVCHHAIKEVRDEMTRLVFIQTLAPATLI